MLVATSLAPVLGAFGIISYGERESLVPALCWFLSALLLVILCLLLIWFSRVHIERETLSLASIRNTDKATLTFLLVYLLPLVTKDAVPGSSAATTVYVFVIIAWAVYHSNAFYFNPLLGLFGYHFYQVTTRDGMEHVLLSTRTIRNPNQDLAGVQLFGYTYLDVGDEGSR